MKLTIEDIKTLLTWGKVIDSEYGNLSPEEMAVQTKLQNILAHMQKKERASWDFYEYSDGYPNSSENDNEEE